LPFELGKIKTRFSDYDMFLFTSGWEGFGNRLVEAMACGTPIVSTDCPSGPSEILENGRWGRLVPVGDDVAMVASLGDRQPPDVASRAAEFSIERAVDGYLKVLLPEIVEEKVQP